MAFNPRDPKQSLLLSACWIGAGIFRSFSTGPGAQAWISWVLFMLTSAALAVLLMARGFLAVRDAQAAGGIRRVITRRFVFWCLVVAWTLAFVYRLADPTVGGWVLLPFNLALLGYFIVWLVGKIRTPRSPQSPSRT